jgi:WD40 repeat protein
VASSDTQDAAQPTGARERPDVFVSYAREDRAFVEQQLTEALVARGKDVWIDVEDIRGGASDWRATVWAGIESATVMVFVLTPDSLSSTVCREEVERADELNKRIIPILRRSVDGLEIPPPLSRPNWILFRREDDFGASVDALIDALELDEEWVEQHARLNQRTGEWLRHDQNGSYLLRGSDLDDAERWLDDQAGHREAPTADQISYIRSSRRAATRRLRGLLAAVALALVITLVLAVAAFIQRGRAIDREKTARAQAAAAQSIAELSRDPEESLHDALEAVEIRPDAPEAIYALRRAVSTAAWTSMFRAQDSAARMLDVEFAEDGRRVATAGSDGSVAVWDSVTGQLVTDFNTGGKVHTVQFSPNGRQVLTASVGGLAETWDVLTGERLRAFETGTGDASSATWGAAGRRVLTVSAHGGAVWSVRTGKLIRQLSSVGRNPGRIRLSLDGRRALTAGRNGTALLWNIDTGARVPLPVEGAPPLEFSLLSRHGRRLVTVYSFGAFCVWDGGRQPSKRFCKAGSGSSDADLSRNGRRFLRADRDGVVEIWDTASTKPIARIPTGTTVSTAQFDRSGEYVVTGSDDGSARVWQVKPERRVALLRGHTRAVRRARFSPDGTKVATVSDDGSARLWPARPTTPSKPGWQRAESTAFSPNSRDVLVVRGRRGAVWNTDTGEILPLEGGITVPDALAWACARAAGCSPWDTEGRFVAGASGGGRAVVWSAGTGRIAQRFGKATGGVVGAEFSPDADRLLSVDGNRMRATIWDLATEKSWRNVPVAQAAKDTLFNAQFVPDTLRVLTVDTAARARLSDPAAGTSTALPGDVYPPGVAATNGGGNIALGTTSGELYVLSGAGNLMGSRRVTDKAVNTVAFSGDGAAIVTGAQSGIATVWDMRTLTATPLRAFGGEVTGATFSPRGDLVLVTSGVTARLWDPALQRVIVELPRTPNVRAEFSPDGSRIVIAGTTRLEVLRCDACGSLDVLRDRANSLLPAP